MKKRRYLLSLFDEEGFEVRTSCVVFAPDGLSMQEVLEMHSIKIEELPDNPPLVRRTMSG